MKFFRIVDIVIIMGLLTLAGLSYSFFEGISGNTAVVYLNNTKYATFGLESEPQEKWIGPTASQFLITFGDGKIKVNKAPCRHKICVKQSYIERTHQQIICVPRKLLIRIENNQKTPRENSDLDGVTF